MSFDNIGASCSTGRVTVQGTKVAGLATVTLFLNGSPAPAGMVSNNGTSWSIGPLTLATGTYNAKLTHSSGKDVFFKLNVGPGATTATITDLTDDPPPGGSSGPPQPPPTP
jgi:hypothetical protein